MLKVDESAWPTYAEDGPRREGAVADVIVYGTPWPSITNLHRLHAFVVVAKELNFHRAAVRLRMTQSPLSRTIKTLEEELGVTLLDRSRRHVRLTAAGALFVEEAQALLAHAESTMARLRARIPD